MNKIKCTARFLGGARGFTRFQCSKHANKNYKGLSVCGTHYKQLIKWESEGRNMKSMIEFWWNIKLKVIKNKT